jgi:hypothetical protein
MPSLRIQHSGVPLGATGSVKVYITPEWYRLIDDLVKMVDAQQARIETLETAVVSLGGEVTVLGEDIGTLLQED